METKNVLLLAGLGVGGYLLYRHFQNQQVTTAASNAAAAAIPPLASTLTNPTNIPQSGVIAPPVTTIPQTPAFNPFVTPFTMSSASPQPSPASGIDPTTLSVVQKWATGDGRPPVLAMMNAMVPSEYAGMYNVITNFWDKGITPIPQAEVDFWNNLRQKYDPTHQSW